MNNYTINVISTFLIVIPLGFALRAFKTAGLTLRLFLFFLIVGLIVDLLMWVLIISDVTGQLLVVFNTYSLVEALFFFWFIWQVSELNILKKVARWVWMATLPFWIFCVVIYPSQNVEFVSGSALFNASYEIIGSFLAGFALLNRIEQGESLGTSPTLWFLLAIFFYCFSTFFLMTLLETFISQRIWFLNNIFNNITYLLYSVGYWVFLRKPDNK